MPSLVTVALPVSVDREFTYSVPAELESSIIPGVRVLVPFGNRWTIALVVDLPLSSPISPLKPIRDVLDSSPVMTAELLQLCRWVSTYYMASFGEVLRAAMPHGFSATSKRMVHPLRPLTPKLVASLSSVSPKRAALLSTVLERGSVSSSDLLKISGLKTINAVLGDLERQGLIQVEEMLPQPRVRTQVKEFLLVDRLDPVGLAEAGKSIPPRRKKARTLLDKVSALHEKGIPDISISELLKETGATSSTLKEFVESGLLIVERRDVMHTVDYGTEEQTKRIVLNESQQRVLVAVSEAVDNGVASTFLLHGVTGSGKTQVYIEAIRHSLSKGKSAIVLVPEISLTPQIVRRFKSHFGDLVGVVHSRMTPRERHDVWKLARAGSVKVVIGPRSAVFAPLNSLGLVVVDEEHESSYKQYDAVPRYNARDVAIVRGMLNQAVTVLGSATPSAESYHNAIAGKYTMLEMPDRIDDVPMPSIAIVDMIADRKAAYARWKASLRKGSHEHVIPYQSSSISIQLHEKILERISRKEGIILLQNRRGFAPFVECPDCGYTERCSNCNVSLTYHLSKNHLRCHYCGLVKPPHEACPQCGGAAIRMIGAGTQRVEQDLARLIPEARVLRMDLDTTSRKGAHNKILHQFENRDADILLGTQMVAKGLDFPHVTLVGVISADTQMLLPDFRANERTFQILTQVSGRAGRSTLKGEVIIQTAQPQHFSLRHVVDHDYVSFFHEELEARKELSYPPYSRLVLVEMRGEKEQKVQEAAEKLGSLLRPEAGPFVLLGPSPALIDKIASEFRWHIILKCLKEVDTNGALTRTILKNALSTMSSRRNSVRMFVDVDPIGMM